MQMTSHVRYKVLHEKDFVFQNVFSVMLNNFNHDHIFLKTKFQGLKHQLSGRISEDDKITSLNDVAHQK